MSNENDDFTLPKYFYLLNDHDKQNYMILHDLISKSEKRYKRYKRVESIQDALLMIRDFCIKGNVDDWKRCLVCGACWVGENIAINTRHLCILVGKCKSSINGAISKMGYKMVPFKSVATKELITFIPLLKENSEELRQWTIRKKINSKEMNYIEIKTH